MRILFIGDIVARSGRQVVSKVLPEIKKDNTVDFVIASADNLAHGRGATAKTLQEMQNSGVDYFTGGDHLFWHKGFDEQIDNMPLLRPANYSSKVPGSGYKLLNVRQKRKLLLISLMGRTFLNELLDDPFTKADEILKLHEGKKDLTIVVDFHAECTSEKYALGFYLDGRVDAVLGTHTHVPTCDNRVLPKGTLYISDVGMTGVIDSVLGVKKEIIMDLYLTGLNQKFEWESTGRKEFRSVLLDTDKKSIERLDQFYIN